VQTEEVSEPTSHTSHGPISVALARHLDFDETLLGPITPECVLVCFGGTGACAGVNARPAQLLDRHERRADVCISRKQMCTEMQREPRWVQHVRGYLCQVCGECDRIGTFHSFTGDHDIQFVIFFTVVFVMSHYCKIHHRGYALESVATTTELSASV